MFCNNCGAENPDTAKFCHNCGVNLDGERSSTAKHGVDGIKKPNDWKWKDVLLATIGLCILVLFFAL